MQLFMFAGHLDQHGTNRISIGAMELDYHAPAGHRRHREPCAVVGHHHSARPSNDWNASGRIHVGHFLPTMVRSSDHTGSLLPLPHARLTM